MSKFADCLAFVPKQIPMKLYEGDTAVFFFVPAGFLFAGCVIGAFLEAAMQSAAFDWTLAASAVLTFLGIAAHERDKRRP